MKKLLALVLALVMSMSLVTISNAAYSDKADIDLKEAVDVLSAVGVFEGSDGKFDAKANLTREQAAKMVAYLELGRSPLTLSSAATSSPTWLPIAGLPVMWTTAPPPALSPASATVSSTPPVP